MKTASAATAGLLIVQPSTAFGTEANSRLQLGLFGCGQRGPWIANFFRQHTNSKCVAVYDYFADRVEEAGRLLEVGEDRQYVGIDGYREILAADDVDAVAVQSPAYFHPEQTVAALEAGKHVYLAKPIAVDAPGCNAIVEAANKHEKKLSCLTDFQTRNNEVFIQAAKAIHDGAIGTPICGQAFFHAGRLNIKTKPGTDVARLRNWSFDIPLSGDVPVEQSIHMMDVANWYLQDRPEKATGTGGRRVRTDVGDNWDHFVVTYTYPDGAIIDFSATQFLQGFTSLCTRVFGSEGTVDSYYGRNVVVRNKSGAVVDGNTPTIYSSGAINNVKDFYASIMEGKYVNNSEEAANSTLTMILGRMAAYRHGTVTWDEMLAKNEPLDPKLDLPKDGPYTPVEPV